MKYHNYFSGSVKNKQESSIILSLNVFYFFSPYNHPFVRMIFHWEHIASISNMFRFTPVFFLALKSLRKYVSPQDPYIKSVHLEASI